MMIRHLKKVLVRRSLPSLKARTSVDGKKLMLGLMLVSGYASAHLDGCVVCSSPCVYEFHGKRDNRVCKEEFWRGEEQVCEKHTLAELRNIKGHVAVSLDQEFTIENEQPKLNMLSKMTVLKKIQRRLSGRR